jgi:hypothetical protein
MSNTLTTEQAYVANMQTGLSIFDNGTFEGISRVADAMAYSPLVPESLRTKKENGKTVDLPHEQVRANCFLICEQSSRWGISPFAALACASNIYGRLMWEGKLVAGVLEAKLGVRLDYEYSGQGEKMSVTVKGTLPGETKERTVNGTVADWKTDQWKQSAYEQRLAYRGAREWARRHAPSIMLGVITEDEFTPEIRDVTPRPGKAVLRETMIEPFESLPEPSEAKAEPAAQPAADPAPNPETKAPEGKQQKERHVRDATFRGIAEKEGKGKTWWNVTLGISGKILDFTTFSKTLSGNLMDLEKGTQIRATIVQNADGKTFSIEDYTLIEEGGLV